MARRLRCGLPVLMAGLLLQTGCVATSLWDNGAATTSPNEPGTKSVTTLPSDKSADLCLKLATKFEQNGNLGEAAAQYEMARRYNPGLKDVGHRIAILYDELGDHTKAMAEYEKELAARPHDADLLNDIGYCEYNRGNWAAAEKDFREAVALNPRHERAWINLGLTLGQEERYQEGMDAFLKVVHLAEAECNQAFVMATQGKRDEAKAAYHRALKADPSCTLARNALGKLEGAGEAPATERTAAKPTEERPQGPVREPHPIPTDVYASPADPAR